MKNITRVAFLLVVLFLATFPSVAQISGGITQSGNVTVGDIVLWGPGPGQVKDGGLPGAATLSTGSGTGNTLTGPGGYFVCTTTCTVTPPLPVAGYQFCVLNDDNVNTVITLGALGGSARYEATARTGYGTAGTGTLSSAGAVADMICIVGRDSTHYLSTTYVGTWVAS